MTTPTSGRGGYRRPANPAPVSGPGALSRRTDGGPQPIADLPDAGYGEQAQFQAIQQGAPLPTAQGPGVPPGGGAGPSNPPASTAVTGMALPTPLSAPTERPGEPVTAGAALGAGPGEIPVLSDAARITQILRTMSGPDITGDVADLLMWAEQRGL